MSETQAVTNLRSQVQRVHCRARSCGTASLSLTASLTTDAARMRALRTNMCAVQGHRGARGDRAGGRLRGRGRDQHAHQRHGHQPGHVAPGALRGGLLHARRLLQQGRAAHRAGQGARLAASVYRTLTLTLPAPGLPRRAPRRRRCALRRARRPAPSGSPPGGGGPGAPQDPPFSQAPGAFAQALATPGNGKGQLRRLRLGRVSRPPGHGPRHSCASCCSSARLTHAGGAKPACANGAGGPACTRLEPEALSWRPAFARLCLTLPYPCTLAAVGARR